MSSINFFSTDNVPSILSLVHDHFQVNATARGIFSNPVPHDLRGISLKLLNQLVDEEFGGRDRIARMSIKELRDEFVIKGREMAKGSYVDYLETIPRYAHGIRTADVFVSYNLDCSFLDMVTAFNRLYGDSEPDIVVFITVFCNNFNLLAGTLGVGEKYPSTGVMMAHIISLCCSFRRMVLVLCQWDDPFRTPVTRLWCLMELYTAALQGHRVDLALCADPMLLFSNRFELDTNIIDSFSSSINVQQSRIFSQEYRKGVLSFIQQHIGFDAFESTVSSLIKDRQKSMEEVLHAKKQAKQAQSKGILILDLDGTLFPADLLDYRSVDISFLQHIGLAKTEEEAVQLRSQFHLQYGKNLSSSSAATVRDSTSGTSTIRDASLGCSLREMSRSAAGFSAPQHDSYPPEKDNSSSLARGLSHSRRFNARGRSNELYRTWSQPADSSSSETTFFPPPLLHSHQTTTTIPSSSTAITSSSFNAKSVREVSAAVADEHIAPRAVFSLPQIHNTNAGSTTALNVDSYYEFVDAHLNYSAITPNLPLVDLLQRLQQRYYLVLFSNSHYLHTERCLSRLGLWNVQFDAIFYADYADISFPIKPEKEAYERVEAFLLTHGFVHIDNSEVSDKDVLLATLRDQISFVDDTPSNVDAARTHGWERSYLLSRSTSAGCFFSTGLEISNIFDLEAWLFEPELL